MDTRYIYLHENMEHSGAKQEGAARKRLTLTDLACFLVRSENYEGPSLKAIYTRAKIEGVAYQRLTPEDLAESKTCEEPSLKPSASSKRGLHVRDRPRQIWPAL